MSFTEIPKKMAVFHDFAGFGHCAHAVALPVISALGVQACPVPTALYSNHMGFPVWHAVDCSGELPAYLEAWRKLELSFDGILCGFLGCASQAELFTDFINRQRILSPTLVVTDPVMGDHGKLYASVSEAYPAALRMLCAASDLITPNITEACLLADIACPEDLSGLISAAGLQAQKGAAAFLEELCLGLCALGPSEIVITGITSPDAFHNVIYDKAGLRIYSSFAGGPSRPGTGDLFASVLAALRLKGQSLDDAVKKAADFVRICTEGSAALSLPVREGVCFENYLDKLIQM